MVLPVEKQTKVVFQTVPTISMEILSNDINFGTIEPGRGYIEKPGAIKILIKANTDWTLYYRCPDDIKNEDGTIIPISHLEWRTPGKDYAPMKKDEPIIIQEGGPTTGTIIIIDLRLKSSWDIPAGIYSLPLFFTLTGT